MRREPPLWRVGLSPTWGIHVLNAVGAVTAVPILLHNASALGSPNALILYRWIHGDKAACDQNDKSVLQWRPLTVSWWRAIHSPPEPTAYNMAELLYHV